MIVHKFKRPPRSFGEIKIDSCPNEQFRTIMSIHPNGIPDEIWYWYSSELVDDTFLEKPTGQIFSRLGKKFYFKKTHHPIFLNADYDDKWIGPMECSLYPYATWLMEYGGLDPVELLKLEAIFKNSIK